jgi:hypothetical protein
MRPVKKDTGIVSHQSPVKGKEIGCQLRVFFQLKFRIADECGVVIQILKFIMIQECTFIEVNLGDNI